MRPLYRNDTLIIQIAVAMIILALVWIIFIRYTKSENIVAQDVLVKQVKVAGDPSADNIVILGKDTVEQELPRFVESIDSEQVNIVKEYFQGIADEDYARSCNSLTKCNGNNPTAVSLFSREFDKLIDSYEYVAIRDLWFTNPSWKRIVCVKYSYRYKDDIDPQPVSEVMSYYTDFVDGRLQITDRVCEKKYKDGSGERPCPIEPNARYCIWNVK